MKTICIAALLAAAASVLTGCNGIAVETTKTWEGHYFSAEECKAAVEDIALDKNESVWILSNRTLKRLLDNTRK